MPINLASFIQPRNGNSYFLLEDVYLRGGFQVRQNAADRDAINELNRKAGMLVMTQDDNKIWVLQTDLATWQELQVGGGSGGAGERQQLLHTTAALATDQWDDFSLPLGKTTTLLRLQVDHPCMVEAYGTSMRDESNPYKFVASAEHLSDDGSTKLSDGSVIYGRRYAILSNMEQPASANIYFRIYNQGADTENGITMTVDFLTLE